MTHACARQRHAVRRLRPPRTPRPGSGTARRRFSECAARSPSERPPALPARRPRRPCHPPSPARTRAALCRWERGIAAPRPPRPGLAAGMPQRPGTRPRNLPAATPQRFSALPARFSPFRRRVFSPEDVLFTRSAASLFCPRAAPCGEKKHSAPEKSVE